MAQLGEPWPEFLDQIESAPQEARRTVFLGTYAYLTSSPPPAYRWFPDDRRHDLAIDIAMALVADDFHKLKLYRRGARFASWLVMVANNRAKDVWARESRSKPVEEIPETAETRPAPTNAEIRIDAARIKDAILKMDRRCRLILLGRLVRQLSNQELCRLFPEVAGDNKTIGNWYRQCRLKLIERLNRLGIRPEDCIDIAIQQGGSHE